MERGPRRHGEPVDRWARDPARGLDAEKKSLAAAERDEQARTAYRERVATRAMQDFVVVDECGSNINLTPIYARAPRGMRAYGQVPRNTEKNTTLIASLTTCTGYRLHPQPYSVDFHAEPHPSIYSSLTVP